VTTPPARPRGVVQRLVMNLEAGTCVTQYRTRDMGVLFSDGEWGWGDKAAAYIFESLFEPEIGGPNDYEKSAHVHVAALKLAGEAHVHPVPWSLQCQMEREGRREAAVDTAVQSVRDVGLLPAVERTNGPDRPAAKRTRGLTPYERMEKENLA